MGPLAKVYSAADSLKRHLFAPSGGVLSDPVGNAQITAGRIQDDLREYDASSDEEKQAAILRKITELAPLGMFIGKGAKLWDPQKAEKFMDMLSEKTSAANTAFTRWRETGTTKFPDGKLRQEIPDNNMEFRMDFDAMLPSRANDYAAARTTQIGGAVRHPELFQAYPELLTRDTLSIGKQPAWIPPSASNQGSNRGGQIVVRAKDAGNAKSVTAHELQHSIQALEGFGQGGSPTEFLAEYVKAYGDPKVAEQMAFQHYKHLAGEAEARLVQRRINMDAAERLRVPPATMWDVPAPDQLVRGVKTDIQLENQRRLAEILRKRRQQP